MQNALSSPSSQIPSKMGCRRTGKLLCFMDQVAMPLAFPLFHLAYLQLVALRWVEIPPRRRPLPEQEELLRGYTTLFDL